MNIDQYRALKAQEAQASATPAPTQTSTPQATPQSTPTQEPAKDDKPNEPTLPEKISIDGVGEVTIDELRNGYLRQSDYTKKTQEVAKNKQELKDAVDLYEQVKQNPELFEQVRQTTKVPATLDPVASTIIKLQNEIYDMKLESEIKDLQSRFPDFEIREVLKTAQSENLTNLESAYLLNKSRKAQTNPQTVDLDKIRQDERAKILAEIEAEKNATQTIITPNGGANIVQDNQPQLSEGEKRVAKMMRLSETDYVKWRDAGKKK